MKSTVVGSHLPRHASGLPGPQTLVRLPAEQCQQLAEYQQFWHRLAVRLLQMEDFPAPWCAGISSAIHGEGKTTGSIGLSVALAEETQAKVALVDADLKGRTLTVSFGAAGEPGLADCLLERGTSWAAGQQTNVENLTLFPAGNMSGVTQELLLGGLGGQLRRRLPQMVNLLKERFQYVVLDLPPVLGNSESEAMLRAADGALLMVRAGVTPTEQFQRAVQRLWAVRLLGVIHMAPPSNIPRWLSYLVGE